MPCVIATTWRGTPLISVVRADVIES